MFKYCGKVLVCFDCVVFLNDFMTARYVRVDILYV